MSDPVLRVSGLNAGYGQTRVLEHIELELQRGEAVSVIGRNGVGKSTLLATLMGHTTLQSGSIVFNGEDISRMPVYRRVTSGIGYVPQGAGDFSVADGAREPAHRRPSRRLDRGARLRAVSQYPGPPGQRGQPALRRRAADAVDRPGR